MSGKRGAALILPTSTERLCEMVAELTSSPDPGTIRELAVWSIQEGLTRFEPGVASPGSPDHRRAVNDVRRALASRLKSWRKKGADIPLLPGESSGAATMDVVFGHFGRRGGA